MVTGSGGASADAPPGLSHRIASVTSGDARFQVLSPTLIRTEYAQDGRFTDSATFNVIGRTAFAPTSYTASRSDGWLTISTSALTLRYQEGSGPFDAQNLSVRLSAGGSPISATPWQRLTCSLGALCEAEQLAHSGVGVASDHTGYTGSGFVAGFEGTGDSLSA
ncbi:alpha-xylosidase, partial [Streptomyces sp. NPDC097610]